MNLPLDKRDAARKVGDAIRFHRRRHNFSLAKLAGRLGVTAQAVSNWENGANLPGLDHLARLGELFVGDPGYLFAVAWTLGERRLDEPYRARIPVVSALAAARWLEMHAAQSLQYDDLISITHPSLSVYDAPIPVFAMTVRGEAMAPVFTDGDVILVNPNIDPIPRDCVVARVAGEREAILRAYKPVGRTPEGGPRPFHLIAENDYWPPIEVDDAAGGAVIGVVIEHRRFRAGSAPKLGSRPL